MSKGLKIFLAIAALPFVAAIFLGPNTPNSGAAAVKQLSEGDALFTCQRAITGLARDPDTAQVPWVKNFGSGDEYYFAWGDSTKHLRLHNGFGLEVPASAACTVSKSRRVITTLSIDGKLYIDNVAEAPKPTLGEEGAKPQVLSKLTYSHDKDGFTKWAQNEAQAQNVKYVNEREVWIALLDTADASYTSENAAKEALRMYKELTGTGSTVKLVLYQHNKPVKEVVDNS